LCVNVEAEQHEVPIAEPAQIHQAQLKAKQPRMIISGTSLRNWLSNADCQRDHQCCIMSHKLCQRTPDTNRPMTGP